MKLYCSRCLSEGINLYLKTSGETICEDCFTEIERLQCLLILAKSIGDVDSVLIIVDQIKRLKENA